MNPFRWLAVLMLVSLTLWFLAAVLSDLAKAIKQGSRKP
jgi:hypothetical protein